MQLIKDYNQENFSYLISLSWFIIGISNMCPSRGSGGTRIISLIFLSILCCVSLTRLDLIRPSLFIVSLLDIFNFCFYSYFVCLPLRSLFCFDFGNTVYDTPRWQFDTILFTCFIEFWEHWTIYTGCASKKQSLKKNSLSQLLWQICSPNLQLSQRRIRAIYTANFVTIFAVV